MELADINPFIRFADKLHFTVQRGPSKTYDCRFLYACDGEAEIRVEETEYPMSHGSLVTFQPGTEYTIYPASFLDLIVFDFDYTQDFHDHSAFLVPCPVASYHASNAHPVISFSDAPVFSRPACFDNVSFIEAVLREIVSEFQQKKLFYKEKSSALFKTVLADLARYRQTNKKSDLLAARIIAYIDANLSRQITNVEIGDYFNYNHNYLNRLMLRYTGKTLHQYIMEQRIHKALTLIQTTNLPMKEIAMSLGFNSPAHFSYCFKRATRLSPQQFREE